MGDNEPKKSDFIVRNRLFSVAATAAAAAAAAAAAEHRNTPKPNQVSSGDI